MRRDRKVRKRGKVWWIRYYQNGKRHEEAARDPDGTPLDHEAARDLLKKREGEVAKGIPHTSQSTRLTFDDAVKGVVVNYTVNGYRSTPDLQRRIDLHLTPYFGGKRLNVINTADLQAFTAKRLEAKAAPAEINRELAIVSRAFRLAIETEIYHGRVPKIPKLKEHNVRSGFFDDEMLAAVRAKLPAALQPVMTFAYVTGWRTQSEILPLEWRQVDRTAHTVRLDVGTTKNGKGRVVDFGDNADLLALIEAQWKQHEALEKAGTICRFVFHRHGKRIKDYRAAWATACTAAGFPGRIPHDLRRSAVRNLVRSGMPDTVAMKITGHRTRSVFDRYDISSETDVREGLGRLKSTMGTNHGDNRSHASADANQQSA